MEGKIMAGAKKEKKSKEKYRKDMKAKGFIGKSYQLQGDVCEIIDRINKETDLKKNEIVSEAIKLYAKADHKKATEQLTPVSSAEFSGLQKVMKLFIEDYLISLYAWGEKDIEDMVSNLKAYKKPYGEMMKEAFFKKNKKKSSFKFTTVTEFRLFLYTYIKGKI